jgi:hypothetical protein
MLLMLKPAQTAWWMMPVPALAQVGGVMDLMRGEPLSLTYLALIWFSSALYSAICLVLLVRLLGKEAIIFGRG